jgi:hypothetical protein
MHAQLLLVQGISQGGPEPPKHTFDEPGSYLYLCSVLYHVLLNNSRWTDIQANNKQRRTPAYL